MEASQSNFSFPSTRYSGSKRKFLDWIWENISDLQFDTCLDLFGGTGSVSLLLKRKGKQVSFNDILSFNQIIGKAIIENSNIVVSEEELDKLFDSQIEEKEKVIQENYKNIFFLEEENIWIDKFVQKVNNIENQYKRAIILAALFQACLSKRPFNLFHRANLYIRTADVYRSFGNKKTWEKPFEILIKKFVLEYNRAVFNNGKGNKVIGGYNALACPNGVNLVYIDPPYFSSNQNAGLDYLNFYSFLEGLSNYSTWKELIVDKAKGIPKLKDNPAIKAFTSKNEIAKSIENLIYRFQDNIIVMSYLDNGMPTKDEIAIMFKKYGKSLVIKEKPHKYALSKQSNKELLFIGT